MNSPPVHLTRLVVYMLGDSCDIKVTSIRRITKGWRVPITWIRRTVRVISMNMWKMTGIFLCDKMYAANKRRKE